jgi:hypothetical protein
MLATILLSPSILLQTGTFFSALRLIAPSRGRLA